MKKLIRSVVGALAASAFLAAPQSGIPGIARAEVVTNQSLPTDGLVLAHPCTLEPLSFAGPIHIVARTTLSGSGANVGLHVNTQGVTATGLNSGKRYQSPDQVNTSLNVGPLPATATVTVTVHFVGNGENFRAHVTLHLTVTPSGAVNATLGGLALRCG